MLKLYTVDSNLYYSGKNGNKMTVVQPTSYHGMYLTKKGAVRRLLKILDRLGVQDWIADTSFASDHQYVATIALNENGLPIDTHTEGKDRVCYWVRYHIGVMTRKHYEELQ